LLRTRRSPARRSIGEVLRRREASRQPGIAICLNTAAQNANARRSCSPIEHELLITFLFSTVVGEGNQMSWFYWDTAWSLFFSLVWFMTITQNPDARIADAHSRDEAFGG
jgi:hypothetical protein